MKNQKILCLPITCLGLLGFFFTIIRCIFSTSIENCCDEKDCFVTERSIMCLDFRSVLHSVSKWLHLYIMQNDDLLLSKYGALLFFSRVFKQIFVILVIQICLFIWSCLGHPVFIFENWVFARKRRYFSDKYSSFQHISHNNHCYLGRLTFFPPTSDKTDVKGVLSVYCLFNSYHLILK